MLIFKHFKGRVRELTRLDELWQASDATMLILYGFVWLGEMRGVIC